MNYKTLTKAQLIEIIKKKEDIIKYYEINHQTLQTRKKFSLDNNNFLVLSQINDKILVEATCQIAILPLASNAFNLQYTK